jgi:hypothetical protein
MFAAEFEPATLETRPERRGGAKRTPVSLDARMGRGGLARALCKVVDVSTHGARLQTFSALKRGMRIRLTLPKLGTVEADVTWADDFVAGCRFQAPLTVGQFEDLIAIG